jgi:hypothetical protein
MKEVDMKETQQAVTYEDRGGESPATAIIIHGAPDSGAGVHSEYEFLCARFGVRGHDWEMQMQELGATDGRHWDRLTIKLANGTKRTLYFDISEFYDM